MRVDSIRLRGIGPFKGDVTVNLNETPGPIVAVVGENGAGKSCMVESILGAIDRATPTRGSLKSLARDRDSYVEVTVVNGHKWTIRQSIDAISGRAESLVLDENGAAALPDSKVSSYDQWRAKHLPPTDVLTTSVFSAQATQGFLGMKEGARKAVLLRTLGIERLEGLAEKARKSSAGYRAQLATQVARIADEEARGLNVDIATAQLEEAERSATVAREAAEASRGQVAEIDRLRLEFDQTMAEFLRVDQLRKDRLAADGTRARQLSDARARLDQARSVVAHADEIRENVARHATLVAELTTAKHVWANRASLEDRLRAMREELEDARTRLANNERLVANADEIRTAIARDAELVKRIADIRLGIQAIEHEALTHTQAANSADVRGADAARRTAEIRERIDAANRQLAPKEAIDRAVAELPALEQEFETAQAELTRAAAEVERLRDFMSNASDERITLLRQGLSDIATEAIPGAAADIAEQTLGQDDQRADAAGRAPAELKAAQDAVTKATTAVSATRGRMETARSLAARAPEMTAAAAAIEAETAKLERARNEMISANAASQESLAKCRDAENRRTGLYGERDDVEDERKRLAPLVAMRDHLAQASARIESWARVVADKGAEEARIATELSVPAPRRIVDIEAEIAEYAPAIARERTLVQAEARVAEIEPIVARLEADTLEAMATPMPELPELPTSGAELDSRAARARAQQAEEASRHADSMVAVAKARLSQANERAATLARLNAERAHIEAELADWNLLAESLGRDGLQAMEIDAAGPRLTELVNNLLHECHGPRFTVRIETQRLDSTGKRKLEDCQVMVIDSQKGREAEGETFSGGERVILGEAISLALSMLACERANLRGACLVRDESGAALDPENSVAYLKMLRHAAKHVDASKVLLISHDPRVRDLVDARIEIANGQVRVCA